VPQHFSNEPFFDSREEATAERPDISTIVQLHGVVRRGPRRFINAVDADAGVSYFDLKNR